MPPRRHPRRRRGAPPASGGTGPRCSATWSVTIPPACRPESERETRGCATSSARCASGGVGRSAGGQARLSEELPALPGEGLLAEAHVREAAALLESQREQHVG